MMTQNPPLSKDRHFLFSIYARRISNVFFGARPVEAVGSFGVYATGSSNPTEPAIAPESRLKGGAVLTIAKLPTIASYVPTVHFLLHYFSTLIVQCGSCFTSACLTISGCGRSRFVRHYMR